MRNFDAVNRRLLSAAAIAFALTACNKEGTIEDGGIYVVRSACPQLGIPAGTGDITLFDPPGSTAAAAIDVEAAITNLRGTCDETGAQIVSTATFDVVATRRDAGPARSVVLPFYNVVMRGGTTVVAKKVGAVQLDFPAGQVRAQASGKGSSVVDKAEASLPQDVRDKLTRKRKAGDADAAIDPLAQPDVKAAVARATFEVLVGFQLDQNQLTYNATR